MVGCLRKTALKQVKHVYVWYRFFGWLCIDIILKNSQGGTYYTIDRGMSIKAEALNVLAERTDKDMQTIK